MELKLWQVDAFADKPFEGNPAAVVPLDQWLDDATLLAIAAENNLSETAFLVREGAEYRIRWFTPAIEVNLCGHATLGASHVLFTHLEPARTRVTYASRSGPLVVERDAEGRYVLDFPAYAQTRIDTPAALVDALGATPLEAHLGIKLMAVFAREADVLALKPDFAKVLKLDAFGVIATAPGERSDFASRYFVPQAGVNEDPVTGAAHCQLTPYWAARLGKPALHARQVSARGGDVWCTLAGDRVRLAGHAVEYLSGTIEV